MEKKAGSPFAFYYLAMVPFITAGLGFGLGGFANSINIPVWIAHTVIMLMLFARVTGDRLLRRRRARAGDKSPDSNQRNWILPAIFLFLPWVLFALFAGFGPPPASAELWVASAMQQEIRYLLLAVGGILAAIGFSFLARWLSNRPGNAFSTAGLALIYISVPLYVINMLYWGFFLTESFRHFTAANITVRPDWYLTVRELFYWISVISLALFYLATALFVMALKKAGLLKPTASNAYIVISIVAILLSLLPPSVPAPFDVLGYFVAVPAISFIIPYLVALNIARGNALLSPMARLDEQQSLS